jgi:hypothetical protein
MTLIAVPKHEKLGEGFSPREQFDSLVHPGRRIDGSQNAANWIDDLVSLRKFVLLCSYCRVKFNPRKHGYRKFYCADVTGMTDGYQTNGKCDGCKQLTINCGGGTGFVHEAEYSKTCQDPMDARRKARARAGAMSAWRFINKWR